MKTLRFFASMLAIASISFTAFGQSTRTYLLQEADDYFKAGRYWDAFFLYRECAKLPEFQSESKVADQISYSSRALFLTRKFQDFAAIRRYEPAKSNLIELINLNPNDPNRGQLPRITLAQGAELHRLAWRQPTPQATADMLKRAIAYYHQAIREGLIDASIATSIKQAEASIKDTGVKDAEAAINADPLLKTNTTPAQNTAPVASPRKAGTAPPEVIILPGTQNTSQPKKN